jgi:outer membrane cobalamin receptor
MIRTLKKLLLILILAGITSTSFSQAIVKGVVVDATNNEKLAGAAVVVKGTTSGVSTDINGVFSLSLIAGKKTIVVQFIGYTTKELDVDAKDGETIDLGTISLSSDQISIDEVKVFASVAVSRKTPVALSKLEPLQIEEKLGIQEFPEILKATPGVYATKQGGGFGDSRINLRGFESANIAVMINGVPVNDMEWGGVYWSNWAGLGDVTRSMQVQRGLGASKVAAPSLGGSINIVTRSTDANKGGSVSYGIGSDGYTKIGFAVSTGLTEKNWAITLLGAKTTGNGYIQGTEFEGYSYFVNISKRINDAHQLSFTAFGAPQWHNQRNNSDKLTIAEWQKQPDKYRYNASYGFDMNGQRKVSSLNVYNKPQFSINHFWTINPESSLSTSIYASIGDGYGTSGQGYTSADRSNWYGASSGKPNTAFRTEDGTFDYGAIYTLNQASETGSKMAMSKSVNSHRWYGLLSTYSTKIADIIDFYGGLDLRYYKGTHTNVITDLYGGDYFIDATSSRPLLTDQSWQTKKLGVGDVVYRDYDGFVVSEGVFGQAEYNTGGLSSFISISLSRTSNWRYDRFYYDKDQAKSETVDFWGYCVKGGANYNINDKHNVFANIGTISRAPFFSGGAFLQSTTSNMINPSAINEKAFSAEVGYGYKSKYLSANVNLYRTLWKDKTMVRSLNAGDGSSLVMNASGVNALHQGVELDFVSKPIRGLELTGMISIGDWKWDNNGSGLLYTSQGVPYDNVNKVEVPAGSPDQTKMNVNLKGIHVGNSAQTTAAIGVKYEMLKGFNIGLDGNYFGRNYANFSIAGTGSGISDLNFEQPWVIPEAMIFDLNTSYRFKIGTFDATFIGNINNLLDAEYISDANDGSGHNWETAQVFYGFGRTFSGTLKIKF